MNVYYRVYPITDDYGHMTLILNKDEVTGMRIGEIVRYLSKAARLAKGSLGLLEEHGSEYWLHTRNPVVLSEFGSWFTIHRIL